MRKSLGNKRKELGAEDVAHIVKLYEVFAENKNSRIFDNVEFGYTTITVERPLRLVFSVTGEHYEAFAQWFSSDKKTSDERKAELGAWLEAVKEKLGPKEFMSEPEFKAALKQFSRTKLSAAEWKAAVKAFSKEDERGAERPGKDGHPEPNSALRDTENIPLIQNIDEYFKQEVLPHVPDAWIDEKSRNNVGYEISFNRYFYEFKPPRPLEEIDADLAQVTGNIMRMLQEMGK